MAPTFREELRQRKPFASPQHEAHLSLVRTGALLTDDVELALRPHGVTAAQFNVLRILRGAEPEGLCRNELRDRMLTRMPDMTRLLDRMEEGGLVVRSRGTADRRLVSTHITKVGLRLLAEVDPVVEETHQRRFRQLGRDQIRSLLELLAAVRQGA
jgi:DNA-binding MarR family transcriptional regulator